MKLVITAGVITGALVGLWEPMIDKLGLFDGVADTGTFVGAADGFGGIVYTFRAQAPPQLSIRLLHFLRQVQDGALPVLRGSVGRTGQAP